MCIDPTSVKSMKRLQKPSKGLRFVFHVFFIISVFAVCANESVFQSVFPANKDIFF